MVATFYRDRRIGGRIGTLSALLTRDDGLDRSASWQRQGCQEEGTKERPRVVCFTEKNPTQGQWAQTFYSLLLALMQIRPFQSGFPA